MSGLWKFSQIEQLTQTPDLFDVEDSIFLGVSKICCYIQAAAYGRKELCDYFLKVSGRICAEKILFRDFFKFWLLPKRGRKRSQWQGKMFLWQKAPDFVGFTD